MRRVVPVKTLHLIPQRHNPAAALIRVDRLSASSVHELRKVFAGLPETATTVILDLRSSQDGSLHHLHLFADALLEEGHLGDLETRSGIRPLNSEPGTILEGRKLVVVYRPHHTEQIDWLAAVAQEIGVPVYRGEFRSDVDKFQAAFDSPDIIEFVPTSEGKYFVGLKTSRLLAADGKRLDHDKPAGLLIGPATDQSSSIKSLAGSPGVEGAVPPSSPPLVIQRPGLPNLFVNRNDLARPRRVAAPLNDKMLIDQIMSHRKEN